MEIEKLIARLDDWGGVDAIYNGEFVEVNHYGVFRLLEEAAAALEQLQAENDRLKDELEKVEAERDAAVNDLNILRKRSGWKCYACFYDDHYDRGVCAGCGYNNDNNWQWRGQKED